MILEGIAEASTRLTFESRIERLSFPNFYSYFEKSCEWVS